MTSLSSGVQMTPQIVRVKGHTLTAAKIAEYSGGAITPWTIRADRRKGLLSGAILGRSLVVEAREACRYLTAKSGGGILFVAVDVDGADTDDTVGGVL